MELLDDKYQLEQLLGQGGMGAVYRATQLGTKRTVAVKVIHPQLSTLNQFVERFRREAEAAGRLRHPNVTSPTTSPTTVELNSGATESETLLRPVTEDHATLIKSADTTVDENLTAIGSVMGTPHYMSPNNAEVNVWIRDRIFTASESLLIACSPEKRLSKARLKR